nr:retrovirus-related Pol polyprotein from transposon TNT 1-94 [Tanacetum cinerariifolium]
ELLHGRTPSIGFMRPFGYPVTIFNTLDSLGKFEGKVDKGFLVGYSVNSKAFRVFNSRTRIVQETLHVNFLENKPNVAGSGPTWLFDIDSPTKTMNYQPVTAGNQTNRSAGFQDKFNAETTGDEIDQQYVLFPVWSSGSPNPQNTDRDAAFDGKETKFDEKKPESEVNVSPSSSAQVYKDHPVTQIIGDLSSTTQTKSMVKVVKDQGGLSQMFNDNCHTLFEDPDHPDKVYKVVKALYGLHQAPRACQDKYVAEILKKFELTEGRSASTLIDTENPLLKDPDSEDVDLHTYRLISWQCKKQTVVATSSIEAEYVAAASGCAQVIWIQNPTAGLWVQFYAYYNLY